MANSKPKEKEELQVELEETVEEPKTHECENCAGTGLVLSAALTDRELCPDCDGSGSVKEKK